MRNFRAADLFGVLWLVFGLIHASFFLLGIGGYYHFLYIFGLASFVIFPLRYWLIEKVLGLNLEGWVWWTAIGTVLAYALAAGGLWIMSIATFICCYSSYNSGSSSFFGNLLLFSFYPIFRFTLAWFQEQRIPKLKNSAWLIENSIGVILVWLALAFFNFAQPAIGSFLSFVAMAGSELISIHSFTTIKANEEKRKSEEMLTW